MSNRMGRVLALVGAQLGSEGKGNIAAHIANDYQIHVRTGGPNAGHTFLYNGKQVVLQSIPCGIINPNAKVVIGRGGLVTMNLLVSEIAKLEALGINVRDRLIIDADCGVISPWHAEEEGGVGGELHQRIGSTGKGVGAARRDRMSRNPDVFQRVRDVADEHGGNWPLSEVVRENTPNYLHQRITAGVDVMLEGAQGSGLSLIHGPWPYVTSNDTNAAQLFADAGISPRFSTDIMLVARTYPIRVAGNSGPMARETDWETISNRMGRETVEKTTVTKKVRRIAEWDEDLIRRACVLNAPTQWAITFMDYLSPEDEGIDNWNSLSRRAKGFCEYVETLTGARVSLVGTGGPELAVVEVPSSGLGKWD